MRYNNYHKHTHISSIFTPDSNEHAEAYIKREAERGGKNYFTTEHGSFGDIFEAKTLCDSYGIRCLAGIEGYIVPNPLERDKSNYHIIIIPKTDKARKKVNRISSRANIEGYYYRPRIFPSDLLALDRDDVYITTACVAGLLKDDIAIQSILYPLIEHFRENVMLEVQNHNVDVQKDINRKALEFAEKEGLRIIAANDSHYVDLSGRYERLELLKGKHINYGDEDEFILDFPTYDTMFERFKNQGVLTDKQITQAMANTLLFDECEEICIDKSIKMPNIYPNLSSSERLDLLKSEVAKRFESIKEEDGLSEEQIKEREEGIAHEMKIIEDTNDEIHTADYFLFNSKLVDLATGEYGGVLTRGGRGSCASFYINRIMGMSQLDRFDIHLPIFPERFASTARLLENRSMPDIDFNVVSDEPFVRAARTLLGEESCYPMVAYGTMQEAEAFRNVCRSKGLEFEEFNDVAKSLDSYRDNKKWKPLIEEANKYVGTIVSASVHPCAFAISDKSLIDEYGVVRLGDFLCVMVTSSEADEYKILKDDFLKVKVWKLISETFKEIGQPIIPPRQLLASIKDDERIWKLIADGITCTLNQIDSDNGRQQAQQYGIRSFEEGAFVAAAIRPSFDSWRDGFLARKPYTTGSKDLDKVLSETGGYILFQESLMRYFDWLGVTPAESIGLIKKISKKKIKQEDFDSLEDRLKKKWVENTGSTKMFDETWHLVQSCISYGFCVSGDTKLYRSRNGTGYHPTVEEMYLIRNNTEYAKQTNHKDLHSKYYSYGYGKTLSLFQDGYIRENGIKDIYFMGERDVYRVETENSKTIKCTIDHKFPTPKGELKLSELSVGDELYCVGELRERTYDYQLTDGNYEKNIPKKGQMGFQKNPNGPYVIYDGERKSHVKNGDSCEICGLEYSPNIAFELHHKDINRKNNTVENLQWLCPSCHRKVHYQAGRTKRYGRGRYFYTEKITSITYVGKENVYSVSMEDPNHNFALSNGLITSNCSSHAAATSLDMCYGAYLKVNYPLEYYTVCFNNYADDDIRTKKLIGELPYFGIKFENAKFRHSSSSHSYDKDTNTIYKGLSAVKYLSARVGDELYEIRDKKYDNFTALLIDLADNFSINARQIEILIKTDFFSEFGNINKLLHIFNFFQSVYDYGFKKQISKAKVKEIGLTDEIVKRFCHKEAPKTYMQMDFYGMLCEIEKSVDYTDIGVLEKVKYQVMYLGSTMICDVRFSNFACVTNVVEKKTPIVSLYAVKKGKTHEVKIPRKVFDRSKLEIGDVIFIQSIKPKKKQKYNPATGKWQSVPNTKEWWVESYRMAVGSDDMKEQNLMPIIRSAT